MSDVDALYAWQVQEAGRWGVVGTITGAGAVVPLVARSLKVATSMRPLAEVHRKATGLPVRLARFELATVLVDLP